MATIKLKFRPSSVPGTEGTLYYQVIHKRKVKWISTGIMYTHVNGTKRQAKCRFRQTANEKQN